MDKILFNMLLQEANLTKKDFATILGINSTAIANWGNSGREIPYWVKSWLDLYISNKSYKDIQLLIKKISEHSDYI